jgi:8-amino-7-oxononanoate synthase
VQIAHSQGSRRLLPRLNDSRGTLSALHRTAALGISQANRTAARRKALVQPPVGAVKGRKVRVGDHWVLSFASASYLGLEQDARVKRAVCQAVCSWGFSLAMPRVLARDRVTADLEAAIAQFTAQPAALIFPSTTHAALDLLPLLSTPSGAIFVDSWAYPTSLEGVREAERRGARVYTFPHNNPSSLESAMRAAANTPRKVVVCNGIYPEGGGAAPLREYAQLADVFGAIICVDDSHGIGIFGKGASTEEHPYGRGGGGLLRSLGPLSGTAIVLATLTKALGIPVAFVAGPRSLLKYAQSISGTFVHSSPPSIATAAGALEALRIQAVEGDFRRRRLTTLVRQFRIEVAGLDVGLRSSGLFPIQTVHFRSVAEAQEAGRFLRHRGIWPVLQLRPPDYPGGGVLRFYITASHDASDVKLAAKVLGAFRATRHFEERID